MQGRGTCLEQGGEDYVKRETLKKVSERRSE